MIPDQALRLADNQSLISAGTVVTTNTIDTGAFLVAGIFQGRDFGTGEPLYGVVTIRTTVVSAAAFLRFYLKLSNDDDPATTFGGLGHHMQPTIGSSALFDPSVLRIGMQVTIAMSPITSIHLLSGADPSSPTAGGSRYIYGLVESRTTADALAAITAGAMDFDITSQPSTGVVTVGAGNAPIAQQKIYGPGFSVV